MKKIIALTALTASLFTGKLVRASTIDEQYQEVYEYFTENMDEMTQEYESKYNIEWNATKINDIVDIYNLDDDKIGYLLVFDKGYLAFNNNMSVLDCATTGTPYYYNSRSTFKLNSSNDKIVYNLGSFISDNTPTTYSDYYAEDIYYPLELYYKQEGFNVMSSMVQIPYFNEVYDIDNSWGSYMPICFSYSAPSSGALRCTMGLMYSLKVNAGINLTPENTSYFVFEDWLEFYTGFDYNYSVKMDPLVLFYGVNHYLTDYYGGQYQMSSVGNVNSEVPCIAYYQNANPLSTAEFCMRIGQASIDSWWVFKDYYDVVMADSHNFFYTPEGMPYYWNSQLIAPYFIVNQNYRDLMYQFFEGDTLLK